MKIIKPGKKRFKELYTIHICRCVCNKCKAEFEAQEGELGRESGGGYFDFTCPYCHSYHSDYSIAFNIRTEEVEWSKVINYDCIRNTHREIEVKEGGRE